MKFRIVATAVLAFSTLGTAAFAHTESPAATTTATTTTTVSATDVQDASRAGEPQHIAVSSGRSHMSAPKCVSIVNVESPRAGLMEPSAVFIVPASQGDSHAVCAK